MNPKTCTLLFLRDGDHILLAMKKRGFGAGRYNGVGGKVDKNETIEQALVRECQEEIGVTPLRYEKVAYHDFTQNETDTPWQMLVHVFMCDDWEGEPIETEEMAPAWFSITDIPYTNMWEDDILWLPQVLEGKKVKGVFSFDKDDHMITDKVTVTQEV